MISPRRSSLLVLFCFVAALTVAQASGARYGGAEAQKDLTDPFLSYSSLYVAISTLYCNSLNTEVRLTHFSCYLTSKSYEERRTAESSSELTLLQKKLSQDSSSINVAPALLTPDSTWSNDTFTVNLCTLLANNAGNITDIQILPSSLLPNRFLLPDCFYVYLDEGIASIIMSQVILQGNSTYSDPLDRMRGASSLTLLHIYRSVFLPHSVLTPLVNYGSLFSNFVNMSRLTIDSCNISGVLPDFLPANIMEFNLPSNNIYGGFPSTFFGNYTNDVSTIAVDLRNNMLSGPLHPLAFPDQPNLLYFKLWLSHNLLDIIDSTVFSTSLPLIRGLSIRLDHNLLTGSATPLLFDMDITSPGLVQFQVALDFNQLTGSSPPTWKALNNADFGNVQVFILTMSNNRLSGTATSAIETISFSKALSQFELDFSANDISGTLPADYLLFKSTPDGIKPSVANMIVDFSCNRAMSTSPAILEALNLTTTSSVLFNVSSTQGGGSFDWNLFQSVNPTPLLSSFTVDISNSPNWTAISPSFWSALDTFQSSSVTTPYLSIIASNTSISGPLILPSLEARLNGQPLAVSLHLNHTNISSIVAENGAHSWLSYLDVSHNYALTGPLPSDLLSSSSIISTLIAHHTSLSGTYPKQAYNAPIALMTLDLSNTEIEFCNTTGPWGPSGLTNCNLRNSSAESCQDLYPSLCFAAPPVAVPPLTNASPLSNPRNCPGNPPSVEFYCNDGVWTTNGTVSTPVLTISTSVVIQGNITSTSIVIQGYGTNITLYGCANNLTTVTVQLTQGDVEGLTTKIVHQLISINASDPACKPLNNVALNSQVEDKSSCKKIKVDKISTAGTLSAAFTPDSSGCNRWWIILVSVIAGVIILGGAVAAAIAWVWHQRRFGEKLSDKPLNG